MDLEFKSQSLPSIYSPNHRPQSISPVWSDKEKPDEDGDVQTSDGDDVASVHGNDAENSTGCNESCTDVLQWDNGIGTLAGSNLKFRMNEDGDIEVITEQYESVKKDIVVNDEKYLETCGTKQRTNVMSENHTISDALENKDGDQTRKMLEKNDLTLFEKFDPENKEVWDIKKDSKEPECNIETTPSILDVKPEVNEEDGQDISAITLENDKLMKQEATEDANSASSSPDQSVLSDNLTDFDPVLNEDVTSMFYEQTTRENQSPDVNSIPAEKEPSETSETHSSVRDAVSHVIQQEAASSEPGKCIICGLPSRLGNRFCSRQCLGRNAALSRRVNQLALNKAKLKVAKRRSYGRGRHHHDHRRRNDIMTVVQDETTGKNDLKIKIRWSSASNGNMDEDYVPELREVSKRKAASTTVNYAGTRGHRKKRFNWNTYLSEQNSTAAPPEAFQELLHKDPFPKQNLFMLGMALEGVDPEHQSLICPLFVAEIRGCRIRLSFCGYSEVHDFWCNADSPLLFPCGFCKETNRTLQPPRGYSEGNFDWSEYMVASRLTPASKECFAERSKFENFAKFNVGGKLEAVDRQNPDLLCVATVLDAINNQVLVHFDGWSNEYDYWCNANSEHLHPAGWCQKMEKELSPPKGYVSSKKFNWDNYLVETRSTVVHTNAFTSNKSHSFETGMKLEVVDPRNKIVIRVATIVEIKDFNVKIHFDGWSDMYDFWTHLENEDLHPARWCEKTGHPLEPPVTIDETPEVSWQAGGCPIPGCSGIGHVQGAKFQNHYSEFGCPYSPQNLSREPVKDRLATHKRKRNTSEHSEDHIIDDPDMMEAEMPARAAKVPGRRRTTNLQNVAAFVPQRKRTRASFDSNNNNKLSFSKVARKSIYNPETVSKWTAEEVAKFVEGITRDPKHGKIFIREEMDGRAMLMLSQSDIFTVLNIKLGPAVKIYHAIVNIKGGS